MFLQRQKVAMYLTLWNGFSILAKHVLVDNERLFGFAVRIIFIYPFIWRFGNDMLISISAVRNKWYGGTLVTRKEY